MLEKISHLGYAVEDIEAAADFYRSGFGVSLEEPEEIEEQGIIAAMFRVGESNIELVQPTRPDSPVGKFIASRGQGFHHVAFEVTDLGAALEELRSRSIQLIDEEPRIGAGGMRMAFIHPHDVFGVLTELVESGGNGAA